MSVDEDKVADTSMAGINKDKDLADAFGNAVASRVDENIWKLLNKMNKSKLFIVIIKCKKS